MAIWRDVAFPTKRIRKDDFRYFRKNLGIECLYSFYLCFVILVVFLKVLLMTLFEDEMAVNCQGLMGPFSPGMNVNETISSGEYHAVVQLRFANWFVHTPGFWFNCDA